jgi:ankyrin repeat protein
MLTDDPALLDIRSGLGETVLHDSAVENGIEAVRFLVDQGADPDPWNEFGSSALQECATICKPGHDLTNVLALLLRAGADPYHHSPTTPCAWHSASRSAFHALRALFSPMPPPTEHHESCEWLVTGDEND